jgi:hypothetical protein
MSPPVFTGLTVRQFDKLVRVVAARGGGQTGDRPPVGAFAG